VPIPRKHHPLELLLTDPSVLIKVVAPHHLLYLFLLRIKTKVGIGIFDFSRQDKPLVLDIEEPKAVIKVVVNLEAQAFFGFFKSTIYLN
jgi:hypothetical protein